MQPLGGGRKRRKFEDEDLYPTCYQLYLYPPRQNVSLEEFEELATLRQRVLHEIGNVRERARHGDLKEDDYRTETRKCMKSLQLQSYHEHDNVPGVVTNTETKISELEKQVCNALEQRRKDHISHYILRLAYCRSEELRRLFLSQETELMRCRLLKAPRIERELMIQRYPDHLPLNRKLVPTMAELAKRKRAGVKVSKGDELLAKELDWVYSKMNVKVIQEGEADHLEGQHRSDSTEPAAQQSGREFYQVKFTEVLDLVQHREVIVKGSYAYLPLNNEKMVVSYICNKFRSLLSRDLSNMVSHVVNVVDQDERITPLLKAMRYKYTGADFSTGSDVGEKISLRQLDTLSHESFAPCMRHLHETLRKEHHLRHFGRLQYGLFLKSINLTLDQALTFWREEFTKKMEPEKFDKQYAYNIRHSFGKEGKRTNYTPYSCMKIIMSNAPGPGDHHGCPFRHWDKDHVQDMLFSYGVPQKSVRQIMGYVDESHYQLACQKYFDVTHRLEQSIFSLEHPSQYFFESRKLRRGQQPTSHADTHDDNIEMSVDDMKEFEDDDLTAHDTLHDSDAPSNQ